MLTYDRYAAYRDAKGLNDHEIARLTGIPKATFSSWKSGLYQPKTEKLLKIAKVLKIPPREIVSRQDINGARLAGDTDG